MQDADAGARVWSVPCGMHRVGNDRLRSGVAPTVTIRSYSSVAVSRPQGIAAGIDGAICSRTRRVTRSGGSLPTASSGPAPIPPSGRRRRSVRPGWGALVVPNGGNSIGRISVEGIVTFYSDPGIGTASGIAAGPTVCSGSRPGASGSEKDDDQRRCDPFLDQRIKGSYGITAGPDGALWFTNYRQLDRADHGQRCGLDLHRRHLCGPVGITTGRDGACGSLTTRARSEDHDERRHHELR